ncbi:DUF3078 domain-containing protein [Spongiivirga citrea]|uniref:DUF3078 domain-containing protein n=1 Tax=Spongiivirga citrea TaxID=1481457 RepID=A0A6M0CPY6_9FLAO|nr:DUF3078 domain-containing protein [Spongiivirga citrea]NER18983.1 DUF3078 domain-containing protein [Spongiivirga citrea]
MHKASFLLVFMLLSGLSYAQRGYQNPIPEIETEGVVKFKPDLGILPIDERWLRFSVALDTIWWTKKNNFGIDLSQASFVNWNAGGNNAIAGLVKGLFVRSYLRKQVSWDNEIEARYGLSKQQDIEVRKTEDLVRLKSTFGYRKDSISSWYYSVKLDFRTQFTDGFKYPDTSTPISRFMAPGYLFLGIGAEYAPKDKKFKLFLSPLTQKSTFVLDQDLADAGSFGVDEAVLDGDGNVLIPGKNSRNELGILITHNWEFPIYKNMNFKTNSTFYSDYLNKFGNIDVDWEMLITFKVNEYVNASIGTQLLYDDDVKFRDDLDGDGTLETLGPRVQFRQVLGVGFNYNF